jgi:hypothetical protein
VVISGELPAGIFSIYIWEGVNLRTDRRYPMILSRYLALLCLVSLVIISSAAAESSCSRVETGSSMWLTAGTITTQMGNRFISSDGTEMYNNVLVGEYAPGIPAQGSVSAFIRGRIMEDGKIVEFDDTTSIIGQISTFSKNMLYSSKPSGLFL